MAMKRSAESMSTTGLAQKPRNEEKTAPDNPMIVYPVCPVKLVVKKLCPRYNDPAEVTFFGSTTRVFEGLDPMPSDATIGVLVSGGLDSAILLGDLLAKGHAVQPFYVRSHLAWEREELRAVGQLLAALARPRLAELVVLDLPVDDLYGDHWSLTRRGVPQAGTADDAVYLPGRNALLLVKAALWCRLRGIGQLALAVLRSNPFGDATGEFFDQFESALARATGGRVRFLRPLADLSKRQVMELGRRLPLELTFSCIAPVDGLHCGRCNKCAERIEAFRLIGAEDRTVYATSAACALASTTTKEKEEG
jgi:7-cyano-7-deazaguanine synthase